MICLSIVGHQKRLTSEGATKLKLKKITFLKISLKFGFVDINMQNMILRRSFFSVFFAKPMFKLMAS